MIEKLLNHYLALDPESARRLQALSGKCVQVELHGLARCFQVIFLDSRLKIQEKDTVLPHAIIKGAPFSLLRVVLAREEERTQLLNKDIVMEGDLELCQKMIELVDALEIDWEEYLSQWIGDIGAHSVGRFARGLKNIGQRISTTLTKNIDEYVHEEADLFPPPEALEDFFRDIDILRMDTDRLEARIKQLEMTMWLGQL